MPETLMQKDTYEQLAREAGEALTSAGHRLQDGIATTGQAVATAGQRVKDGVRSNPQEMMILAGTLVFVVVMGTLGALLISVG